MTSVLQNEKICFLTLISQRHLLFLPAVDFVVNPTINTFLVVKRCITHMLLIHRVLKGTSLIKYLEKHIFIIYHTSLIYLLIKCKISLCYFVHILESLHYFSELHFLCGIFQINIQALISAFLMLRF